MPLSSTAVFTATSMPGEDAILQRFWEVEKVPSLLTDLTNDEQVIVKHYHDTHVYSSGRYKVTSPRKPEAPQLGDSRVHALQRFRSNERSISLKGNWETFQGVIQEYLDLGHAEPVPASALSRPPNLIYYMPMHAVIKESNSTTKLRVVFDASAKTTSGVSLNDCLMIGPTLFPNITDILIRFRTYAVALTSDISKMNRAVELCEQDHDLHRFWHANKTSEVFDYQMTRVTFGIASSPFAAVQSLQQTTHDFGDSYPIAKSHVMSSFYIDDCLAGSDSPQEAIELYSQLRQLLLKGGFDLRKWRSSSQDVIDAIDPSLLEPSTTKMLSDNNSSQHHKTLGMIWNANSDCLHVKLAHLHSPKGGS